MQVVGQLLREIIIIQLHMQWGTLSSTTQTLICNPGYTDPNGAYYSTSPF